jgi:hypothetical protein
MKEWNFQLSSMAPMQIDKRKLKWGRNLGHGERRLKDSEAERHICMNCQRWKGDLTLSQLA